MTDIRDALNLRKIINAAGSRTSDTALAIRPIAPDIG